MPLNIETFDNHTGSFSFFKALGHPLAVEAAKNLRAKINAAQNIAAYDVSGGGDLAAFTALHGALNLREIFVQDIAHIGREVLGIITQPITAVAKTAPDLLFVPTFDPRIVAVARHIIPDDCEIVTLDTLRLPERLLTDKRNYLNRLNFATNLLFFREQNGLHTRLVTANYWGGYGGKDVFMWCRLFDGNGAVLADFETPLGNANATVVLDSRDIRSIHNLPEFCGQVFLHVVGAAGHDIVKYVVDTFGDDAREFSCTHDANAWPSDLYAGLPAPEENETITLWVQNSHPTPIRSGDVGFNIMGDEKNIKPLTKEIPPYATQAVNVGALLPDAKWPAQIEIQAGRYFVRPRYEGKKPGGRLRINHVNVERNDLQTDSNLAKIAPYVGKGFILPAPLLPVGKYRCECLPTPMSTAQLHLPLLASIYDTDGNKRAEHRFGNLPRRHEALLDFSELAKTGDMKNEEGGHVELTYDFAAGNCADGWLHALFRYTVIAGGHMAETSFGAHMFNHIQTYKNEPQSYKGPPPGLSTRLFLRSLAAPMDTLCYLIYPVGEKWHDKSDTWIELKTRDSTDVAKRRINIPAGGSYSFSYLSLFDNDERQTAGENAQVFIRDATCRLFGYHGALNAETGAFAFDHMFGF